MSLYRPTEPPEVLGPRYREQALEPKRTALISVDMQNDDCSRKKPRVPRARRSAISSTVSSRW